VIQLLFMTSSFKRMAATQETPQLLKCESSQGRDDIATGNYLSGTSLDRRNFVLFIPGQPDVSGKVTPS
jgi:hypothetical protein